MKIFISLALLMSCNRTVVDHISTFKFKAGEEVRLVNPFYELCTAYVIRGHDKYFRRSDEPTRYLYDIQVYCPGIKDQELVVEVGEILKEQP